MKLELKHLAPYLPYGLKVQFLGVIEDSERVDSEYVKIGEISNIGNIEIRYKNTLCWLDFKRGYFAFTIDCFKPILRPLSDLTKEIEINVEKFVPIDNFIYKTSVEDFTEFTDQKHNIIHGLKYADVQLLLEWHFDVFGLIEQNLAIDTNTLNK